MAFENAAAVGSGVEAARKAKMRKGSLPKSDTNIIIVGGDGGTSDIGFQALSGMLERGHNVVYLCLDNEAYMNTGIPALVGHALGSLDHHVAHGQKFRGQGHEQKGPSGYRRRAPHPVRRNGVSRVSPGSHEQGEKGIDDPRACVRSRVLAVPDRLAHENGAFGQIRETGRGNQGLSLYEVIYGKYALSRKIAKPKPVRDYLSIQGRFRHLTDEAVQAIQDQVDERYAEIEYLASANQA